MDFNAGIISLKKIMKKLIIVLAVSMFASDGMAQNGGKEVNAAPQMKDILIPPPPPPPPPLPPEINSPENKVLPPPSPALKKNTKKCVCVNEKGYSILVQNTREGEIILLRKKGVLQKIRMTIWNAKPEYFENKYGKLPPPPPPPPPPAPLPPKPPFNS